MPIAPFNGTYPAPDTTAPTAPGTPAITQALANETVKITVTASTDAVGVIGYAAFVDGSVNEAGRSATTSINLSGVPAGAHSVVVRAFDARGNYSVPSASASFVIPEGKLPGSIATTTTVAALGDSITAGNLRENGQYCLGGYLVQAAIINPAIEIAGIFSLGGSTIETCASDYLPKVLSVSPDVCCVEIGVNNLSDALDDGVTAANKIFNLIVSPLLAAGIQVILLNIPGRGLIGTTGNSTIGSGANGYTAISASRIAICNNELAALCANIGSVSIVDFYGLTINPVSLAVRSNLSIDFDVHLNHYGAQLLGEVIAGIMPFRLDSSPSDFDSTIVSSNPLLSGANVSGVKNTGVVGTALNVTGTLPDSSTIRVSGTTTAVVCEGNTNTDTVSSLSMACSGFGSKADFVAYIPTGGGSLSFESVWGIRNYFVGQIVQPTTPNGFLYKCVVAGATGATQPVWPTTVGGTVSDGTGTTKITWMCIEPVVNGSLFRMVSKLRVTAQVGWISIEQNLQAVKAGGSLLAELRIPIYGASGTYTAQATANQISSPMGASITHGSPVKLLPKDTLLTLKSNLFSTHLDTARLTPALRIYGNAGSTCTVVIESCYVERVD